MGIKVRGKLIEIIQRHNCQNEEMDDHAEIELNVTEEDIRKAIERGNKNAFVAIPEQGDQSYKKVIDCEARAIISLLTEGKGK